MAQQNKKRDVLFSLASHRIPGGYEAHVRIATKNGYIVLAATAKKEEGHTAGLRPLTPPQAAAVKEVIGQAASLVTSSYGTNVKAPAKFAILSVQAARELTERAREGDQDARQALVGMANSPSKALRKAVHAQRLFGER